MDSYDTIVNRMKEKFSSLAGYSPDDASDIGIRMKVLAGEIYSLYNALEWLKMQSFAQTAQGEQLDLKAQERGLERKSPVAAEGMLTFSCSAPLWYNAAVPAGTVCSTAGDEPVRYVTLQEAILPQGQLSVSVAARAETPGRAGNTQPGTVTIMVTPPPSLSAVTNPMAFTGGEDAESDSELRGRLMKSYSGPSNGTNAAFYREFALRYDGVHSVGVVPRENGAGSVGVYLGGKGGVPAADVVGQVNEDLNRAREINVAVHVAAAQTVPVDVELTVFPAEGFTQEEVRDAAGRAIQEYFSQLGVGEPVIVAALGVTVLATGVVKNYRFNSAVTADKIIAANQLAVCGSVNIIYTAGNGI